MIEALNCNRGPIITGELSINELLVYVASLAEHFNDHLVNSVARLYSECAAPFVRRIDDSNFLGPIEEKDDFHILWN